jgi:hypothetical protein
LRTNQFINANARKRKVIETSRERGK